MAICTCLTLLERGVSLTMENHNGHTALNFSKWNIDEAIGLLFKSWQTKMAAQEAIADINVERTTQSKNHC